MNRKGPDQIACKAPSGILLVNKPKSWSSFSLVRRLRRLLNVKKIGHAGTLDPFATGVMVMLVGREYTRLSDKFLNADKEYRAVVRLGIETDSFDCDGKVVAESEVIPSHDAVEEAIAAFQGEIEQLPPMFSAKKVNGKKLYDLARENKTVERKPVNVRVKTELLKYCYPYLEIRVNCSKGTYIRAIAHDMGKILGCGAHLTELTRTRSGNFKLEECIDGESLEGLNASDLKPVNNR